MAVDFMKNSNKHYRRKHFIIVLLTVISLALFLILSNLFLKNYIIGKVISSLVFIESQGKYELEIENLDYNLVTSDLSLNDLKFVSVDTNENVPDSIASFLFEAESVEFDLFNFFELIYSQKIEFRRISVIRPELYVRGHDFGKHDKSVKGSDNQAAANVLGRLFRNGKVRELYVEGGKFYVSDSLHINADSAFFILKGYNLKILDFEIEDLFYASYKDMFFKTFQFEIGEFEYFDIDAKATVSFEDLNVDSKNDHFAIKNIHLYNHQPSDTKFNVIIPEIAFYGVKLDSILHNNLFVSNTVLIDGPDILLHFNQRDQQAGEKDSSKSIAFPFGFRIDTFKIENANADVFSDRNTIFFHNADLSVDGINIDSVEHFDFMDVNKLGMIKLLSDSIHFKSAAKNELITVSEIDIDESSGRFDLMGLLLEKINSDSSGLQSKIKINIPFASVKDTFLRAKLKDKELDFDSLIFKNPYVNVNSYTGGRKKGKQLELKHILPSGLDCLSWEGTDISKGVLEYNRISNGNRKSGIKTAFALKSTHGCIDKKSVDDENWLRAEMLNILLSDFNFENIKTNEDFSFASLKYLFQDDKVLLKKVNYSSRERFRLDLHSFQLDDFDLLAIIEGREKNLGKLTLVNPYVKFSNSREVQSRSNSENSVFKKAGDYGLKGVEISGGNFKLIPDLNSTEYIVSSDIDFISIAPFIIDDFTNPDKLVKSIDKIELKLSNLTLPEKDGKEIQIADAEYQNYRLEISEIIKHDNDRKENPVKEGIGLNARIPEIILVINDHQHNFSDSILFDSLYIAKSSMKLLSQTSKSTESKKQNIEYTANKKPYCLKVSNFFLDTLNAEFIHNNAESIIKLKTSLTSASTSLSLDFSKLAVSALESSLHESFNLNLFNGSMTSGGTAFNYNNIDLSSLDNKYNLIFDTIRVRMLQDEQPQNTIILPAMKISGIEPLVYPDRKNISLDCIELSHAAVEFFTGINNQDTANRSNHKTKTIKAFDTVFVKRLDVLEADVDISKSDTAKKSFSVNDISFGIDSLRFINNETFLPDSSLLFADVSLRIPGGRYVISDSLYTIGYKNLKYSYSDNVLEVDSLVLLPNFDDKAFFERVGHQTDRMNISVSKIRFSGFDYSALYKGSFDLEYVDVDRLVLEGFRNKAYPFPEDQRRQLPVTMLRKISFPLNVKHLSLSNSHISYSEHIKGSLYPGEVFLSEVNTDIYGVSNLDYKKLSSKTMNVSFSSYLMGQGLIDADMFFPLYYSQDTFKVTVKLKEMDLTLFSDMTRNLFGVDIKKGRGGVDSLLIRGNNDYSAGIVYMPYRKLKISLYNRFKGKKRSVGSSILAFLANELIIKSNNPKPVFGRMRSGEIYAKRDKRKSFFNFVWKSILSGIETTMGFENRQVRLYNKQKKKASKKK